MSKVTIKILFKMSKGTIKYLGIIATVCIKNAYDLVEKTYSFQTFILATDRYKRSE